MPITVKVQDQHQNAHCLASTGLHPIQFLVCQPIVVEPPPLRQLPASPLLPARDLYFSTSPLPKPRKKMSASLLRVAVRGPSSFLRANLVAAARPQPMATRASLAVARPSSFSTSTRMRSEHQEETFEEFSAR